MNCVEISKDADQLVCGDDKGTLTVWDIQEAHSKVILFTRVSELGIVDITNYSNRDKYLVLIKERRILMIEINNAKIKQTTIFIVPNPHLPNLSKSLHVFPCGSVLLNWQDLQSRQVYLLKILSTHVQNPICPLPSQSVESLIPNPVAYPSYFYYLVSNNIYSYSILDSSTKIIQTAECIHYFTIRPMNSPLQLLLVTDHNIVFIDLKNDKKLVIEGIAAVFVGKQSEVSKTLLILSEDRVNINIYDISSQTWQNFNLNLKIKNIF